jgi:hypothetical protein
MEPSGRNWSQPVANRTASKRLIQAKTVAVRCDQLPESSHGKEGVSGSSPEEGSAKAPQSGVFSHDNLHHVQRVVGMEPFVKPPVSQRAREND